MPVNVKLTLRDRRRGLALLLAVAGTAAIVATPAPDGLSTDGKLAVATMYFAAVLWVTRGLPLAVTALSIPVLLTAFGVYGDLVPALANFADPLIFLFIAGFMLANALQKYDIDRRIALYLLSRLGSSPRNLVGAIMVATAGLSMWVSNTATTAMMTPIALGVLAEVIGRESVEGEEFSNLQVATLLGTAYAASVGGVGTLIGTPPNAVLAASLDRLLDYQISFLDWMVVGLPVVVVTLPVVWYVLVYHLYPPEVENVEEARERASVYLEEEGVLDPRGRRVAAIFTATALLWVVGGVGPILEGVIPANVHALLFGAPGREGLLYFPLVGLYAIPALVIADTMDWDDLVDIDWGTILLFGGGIALADGLQRAGATEWFALNVFDMLVGAPIVLVVGGVVLFSILMTELTSNTATTSIIAPLLIGAGSALAATLGVPVSAAAVYLAVAGTIAVSHAFALPVSTPPNAIVFGSGHMSQEQMLRAGMVLNVVITVVLTLLITALFYLLWPTFLW